jgi:hypothetical protein
METTSTSQTLVNFYHTTERNIPAVSHLYTRCRENLKSHKGETTLYICACFKFRPILNLNHLVHSLNHDIGDMPFKATSMSYVPTMVLTFFGGKHPLGPDLLHFKLGTLETFQT